MCGIITIMISQLHGTIAYKDVGGVVLDVGGVGYKVSLPKKILISVHEQSDIFLWTHLAVRENAMELYGFSSKEELDFFEMLLDVSGIGPKSALAILNLAPIEQLSRAIREGDTQHLTKVSGIGKKTAAKIVLELQEKLGDISSAKGDNSLKEDIEALEALTVMGYSAEDAREALREADKTATVHDMQGKLRAALKMLNRK